MILELTIVEVDILLELLSNADPTWDEDAEKVYILWSKLMECKNEAC